MLGIINFNWVLSTHPCLPFWHSDSEKLCVQKERKCIPCVSQPREVSLSPLLHLSQTEPRTTSHWAQPYFSPAQTHTKHLREAVRTSTQQFKPPPSPPSLSLSLYSSFLSSSYHWASCSRLVFLPCKCVTSLVVYTLPLILSHFKSPHYLSLFLSLYFHILSFCGPPIRHSDCNPILYLHVFQTSITWHQKAAKYHTTKKEKKGGRQPVVYRGLHWTPQLKSSELQWFLLEDKAPVQLLQPPISFSCSCWLRPLCTNKLLSHISVAIMENCPRGGQTNDVATTATLLWAW